MDSVGTQETQDASQAYMTRPEDDQLDSSCWGLLWPIEDKRQTDGPALPWRFNKDKNRYTLGRGPNCDVKVVSQIISNNHCYISWDGALGPKAGITITDISRNGTYVKSRRIPRDTATLLHSGDEIGIGLPGVGKNGESHRFTFRTPVPRQELKGIHINYELQSEIGRGSFAPVVKALHRQTGKFVAIKVIPKPQSLLQPNTVKMLEREVAILRKLVHPNIVALHEVVPGDTELCLVMELVDGGDLFEYIVNTGRLSEERSGELTAQLCDAMAYIHSEGITHRDLKPENILLTSGSPPKVKVADFGLAKCVNNQTMLKTMCGTPSYLAPEVVLQTDVSGYDHKVDSWSAGAIVFAMLTGQGAFTEDENQALTQRVKNRTVTWIYMQEVGCSQEAFSFVEGLMQFDPVARPSLAECLAHPWLYPRHWQWKVPSYLIPQEQHGMHDSPRSFSGSIMSAPGSISGVNDDFENLEITSDSNADSPAMLDFDDETGGSNDLSASQQLRRQLQEREKSWDIIDDDSGDPDQTPLAVARLQLLDEDEPTTRQLPPILTNLQEQEQKEQAINDMKRKRDDSDNALEETSGLGRRKASKMSSLDTPTATNRKGNFNGTGNGTKKTTLRGTKSRTQGQGPVARDFAGVDE